MIYTKEQLEGMSDFELSSIILNDGVNCFPTTSSESQSACEFHAEKGIYSDVFTFDINNPNDIMPLAFEAGISVVNCGDVYNANDGYLSSNGLVVDIYQASEHTNPLRAIAIVYILIKQTGCV